MCDLFLILFSQYSNLHSEGACLAIVFSSVQQPTLAGKCQVSCWFLLVSHRGSSPSMEPNSRVSIELSLISSLFVAGNNEYSVRPDDIIWRLLWKNN